LSLNLDLDALDPERVANWLQRLDYVHIDDLLVDIARGNRLPIMAAQQLSGDPGTESGGGRGGEPVAIRGTEGFMVNYAGCCHPIPGDPIAGYLSAERGMVVHRDNCHNLNEIRGGSDRFVALRWDDAVDGEYAVALRIELENRRGQIAVLATRINSLGINIEKISSEEKDSHFTYIDLEIAVQNRVHLARTIRRIRSVPSVRRVSRTRH